MRTTRRQPRPTLRAEAVQLAPTFDADRLAEDLAAVSVHRWEPQRIHAPGGGVGATTSIDWRVLPLRSPGGDPRRTDPGGPGPADFAPTRWLQRMPYLREVLDTIPAPLNAVRLMALGPGAVSHPHSDPKYALDRGLARLHLPLVTHPGAVLVLDGIEHRWQPGTLWYGDFSREHQVRNTGDVTRVHTVIDVLPTRDLASWFPAEWQVALAEGEALFNRPTPRFAPCPADLPCVVGLPTGFTDFDTDDPLAGLLEPVEVTSQGGQLALATAKRLLALAPVAAGEYRFVGWSEQRTVQFKDGGVVLRVRRGRDIAERSLPTPTHTEHST